MKTFAHVETGCALEPHPADDDGAYLKSFPGVDTSDWTVTGVPDDTQHGAKSDGQGGWVNPPAPKPPPAPQPTTKQQILTQIAVLQGLANQLP